MSPSAVRTGSTAVVAAALALALLAPGLVAAAGPALLGLAALAGMPHGAADVALLAGDRSVTAPVRVARLVAYAALAAAAVLLAVAFPSPGLVVLLVLSVVHFAEGEAAFDTLAGGAGSGSAALAVATSVIALPMAAHPEEVRLVLEPLAPALAGAALSGPGRVLLAALAGGLVAVALVRASGRARAEVALVAALAVLAPPLVAFAAWFAGWHGMRHLSRVIALDPDPGATARLLRASVLPSLGGLALVLGLVLVGGAPVPAVILALLALTVPHALVVERALGRRSRTPAVPLSA